MTTATSTNKTPYVNPSYSLQNLLNGNFTPSTTTATDTKAAAAAASSTGVAYSPYGTGGATVLTGGYSSIYGVSLAASRPAFDILFNQIQNRAIDEINKKSVELNNYKLSASDTAELDAKRAKYVAQFEELENLDAAYAQDVTSLNFVVGALADLVGEVYDPLITATQINEKLASVRDVLANLMPRNSSIIFGGGDVTGMLRRYTPTVPDIAADKSDANAVSSAASAAIPTIQATLNNVNQMRLSYTQTGIIATDTRPASMLESLRTAITDIDTQKKRMLAAHQAEMAKDIQDLKNKYSIQLTALSSSYEASYALAEQMASTLAGGASTDGTLVGMLSGSISSPFSATNGYSASGKSSTSSSSGRSLNSLF